MTRPETTRSDRRLAPLDGVRAVAIVVVMAYHSGIPGVRVGGFYGQDAFFVLSGLLITTLLLREGHARRGIDLIGFWGRRVRRLLPALVVLLLVVDLYVSYVAPAGRYPGFSGDAFSTLFYVSNWHLLAASSNYFAATGSPSLLTHTWSLAIEEQYYLVWPLVVLAVLWSQRGRTRRAVVIVLAVASAGTAASALWMARLYADGASPSRLYYGTDTHAQCLLVGSALAAGLWLWAERSEQATLFPVAAAPAVRAGISVAGVVGAGTLCWLWTHVTSTNPFAYQGGFLCVALCTAAVLLSITCVPRGPLARLLGFRPIAFVGLISYGMYLWYFPMFAFVTGANTGLRGWPLFLVRVAAVMAAAVVSYYAVEVPLRTGRLLRVDPRSWEGRARPALALAAALVLTIGVVSTTPTGRASAAPRVVVTPVAAPASTTGPPTRVLLVGDSTGLTLGNDIGVRAVEAAYNFRLDNGATLGCGLAVSTYIREHGARANTPPDCNTSSSAADQWPALLKQHVDATRPDVVLVVAGRWEAYDRKDGADAPWQNITQAADAQYVRSQMELAVAIGSSDGARVALATAPYFSSGEQPDGAPWSEDDPARVVAYNNLVEEVAAAHRGLVSVVPIGAVVCPAGRFQTEVDGVTVRAPDGVHYPFFSSADPESADPDTLAEATSFGAWIAPRILPSLLSRTVASPG